MGLRDDCWDAADVGVDRRERPVVAWIMARPADFNRRAKAVADLATGRAQEEAPSGRQLCGLARAAALSPERRREIARMGAAARWAGGAGRKGEPKGS